MGANRSARRAFWLSLVWLATVTALALGRQPNAAVKETAFDHNRDTTFALEGQHAEVTCKACHPGLRFQESLGTKCLDCHRGDDVHKGRQGATCEECHVAAGWKQIAFDHDKDTDFKLLGEHRNVTCAACHQGDTREVKLDTRCVSCHQADDVHHGQLGTKCEECHAEQGWGEQVAFDHDLTQFPLIGLHATTPCGACHLAATFKEVKSECIACHQPDDAHKGKFGTLCAACHNPNGWGLWEFDHDTQTAFKLEGAHRGLACETCHQTAVTGRMQLPSTCVSCHEQDDVHQGEFGRQCDRCHTVESFQQIIMEP